MSAGGFTWGGMGNVLIARAHETRAASISICIGTHATLFDRVNHAAFLLNAVFGSSVS